MNEDLQDALNGTGKYADKTGLEAGKVFPPPLVILTGKEALAVLGSLLRPNSKRGKCDCAECMAGRGHTREEIEASGWAELEQLSQDERPF